MNTKLQKLKNCLKFTRLALMGFVFAGVLSAKAQLSGNYTIDTLSAASSTNFKSFGSLRNKLVQSGVSGAVVVKVLNGPYTEQLDIPAISSMSSTKTVTIKGNMQTLKFNSSNSTARYTVRMNGADYFTFDSLIIRAEGSSYAVGVHFKNSADYNTFKNCTIECPKVNSPLGYYYNIYSSISACVMISNSDYQGSYDYYYGSNYVSNQGGNNGAYNTITNCTLNGADNNGVSGPQYGIFETGNNNYYSYSSYVQNNNFTNNKIKNFYTAGICCVYTNGSVATGNDIFRDIYWSNTTYTYMHGIYNGFVHGTNRKALFQYNTIRQLQGNNSTKLNAGYYPYYIMAIRSDEYSGGSGKIIDGNLVYDNEASGYFYGIYNYQMGNNDLISNNIFYNNFCNYYLYNQMHYYPYGGEISHNLTFVNTNISTNNGTKYYYWSGIYGTYFYHYTTHTCKMRANNVLIDVNQGTKYGMMVYGIAYFPDFSDNNAWVINSSTPFYPDGSGVNAAGLNASLTNGKRNTDIKSKFNNPSAFDFKLLNFVLNNKVPYSSAIAKDQKNVQRNKSFTDVGPVETPTDIRTDLISSSLPSNVCSGYKYYPTVKITNLFADTIFNFRMTAKAGNQAPVHEIVATKVAPNASLSYTFTTPVTFNVPGNITMWAGNNMPDDNTLNDTLKQTTTVSQSPSGGKYTASALPTNALYQPGKTFDITIVGEPVIYDLSSPKFYTSGDFGTKWTANTWVETEVGSTVLGSSDVTVTQPTGTAPLQAKIITTTYEDAYLLVKTKVSDLINGCDTIITRRVLQYPKVVPKFSVPATACNGDAVLFSQQSTVKSGAIEYMWDFGTGNPADNSEAPSPVFVFPGPGTYKVKMTAKTVPYGFASYDSINIVVNPIPTVKFTKINACEGQDIVFTNQTVPATSTYVWNFGTTPASTSTLTNPTKKYAAPGAYTVTLTATLSGCKASASQRVYQFDKPKAAFSLLSGVCENDMFKFDDESTINGGGNIGRKWDFNDNGALATEEEPEHKFSSDGTKNVKLVSISEFGCKDSISKPITVKPAPEIAFTQTEACSNTPTIFTNNTPTISGTNSNFSWNFGDGGTSVAENPTHNWSNLGPKKVTFKIALDNGCSAELSKDLTVGVQPTANFTAMNVCAGQPVVFDNQTSWPQGEISYDWDFGGIGSSTNSDPQFTFNNTTTRTWFVRLKASIAGGCSNEITKPVTVTENPSTCDFDAFTAYERGHRGMVFRPKTSAGVYGKQSGVSYTFVYGNEGSSSDTFHDWQTYGTYTVTMRAKNAAGCECSMTKQVSMLASTKDFSALGIKMYPNPNNGSFVISTGTAMGADMKVEVLTMTGQVLYSQNASGSEIRVNAGNLSQGMYMVRLSSGETVATGRIVVK